MKIYYDYRKYMKEEMKEKKSLSDFIWVLKKGHEREDLVEDSLKEMKIF